MGEHARCLPSAVRSLLGFTLPGLCSFIPSIIAPNSPVLRGFSGPGLVQMKENGPHLQNACCLARPPGSGMGPPNTAWRRIGVGKALTQRPQKVPTENFPGGAVVKNPPANARDTGSIPGPGRSHMPWSN